MYEELKFRVKDFANYIVENNSTIRACAKHFNIAKSTVHYDLKYRLKKVDPDLYEQVKKILIINFNEKHLRGGESTKQKFLQEHKTEINV